MSLGAGVQSTTLFLMASEGIIPQFDYAIFADTQEEPKNVYHHLQWLLSRPNSAPILIRTKSKLGDDLMRGENSTKQRFASIPAYTKDPLSDKAGITRRQCTREYKLDVIERAIRREICSLPPRARMKTTVTSVIGISTNEAWRAINIKKRADATYWNRTEFPLLNLGYSRVDCIEWLKDRVPHEVPRSACVFCPYHDDKEWINIRDNDPEGWARAIQIDEALRTPGRIVNRNMNHQMFLHRSCVPLKDVVLIAQKESAQQQEIPGFYKDCLGMCGM